MKRSDYYDKGIYKGDEFKEEVGNVVWIADDKEEIGYVLCFDSDNSQYDNMHDDDFDFVPIDENDIETLASLNENLPNEQL